jgi:DNA invertase Pin-like site-specific DNA recombinase
VILANTNRPLAVMGIYARFSNDKLQRDASIDDQVRTCTETAEQKGWLIDRAILFSDAGASGARMATREGIQNLLKRIESDRIKNYHGFLFYDSSRLGRNLGATS